MTERGNQGSLAQPMNVRPEIPLWGISLYADLIQEVDPRTDHSRFRDRRSIYEGDSSFWNTPSPEPVLSRSLQSALSRLVVDERLINAASVLAARVAEQYAPESLLLVAILRAGVPVASWLSKMLAGSTAVATSLFVGIGIDKVAVEMIKRDYPQRKVLFVDGWTGRGGVAGEIKRLAGGQLAVLCDPWGLADFRGTTEDLLSPSALFTGPTTMGFSRTFTRSDGELFGAFRFPGEMLRRDWVDRWISARPEAFDCPSPMTADPPKVFHCTALRIHANEVARALINSNPKRVLFFDTRDTVRNDYELLLELASMRGVEVELGVRSLKKLATRVACELDVN
jgi:hypothetical protein